MTEEIKRLTELRDAGILTEEEFEQKRRELMQGEEAKGRKGWLKPAIIAAAVVVVAIVSVTVALSLQTSPIVGKWYEPEWDIYLEFTRDGHSIWEGKEITTGTYEIIDDEYVRFEGPGGWVETWKFRLTGDTLIFPGEGLSYTFKRVR